MRERGASRTFPATGSTVLADVRRFVEEAASPYLSEGFVQDLQLAVTEACANSIRHSGTEEIRVTVSPIDTCLEIVVQDDGVYRMTLPVIEGEAQSHRGLYLMAAMVDDFSLRRGTESRAGTTVRLVKCAS
jgi:anti-sigma regulatory factor (Ser/Thr protein kinase)